MVSGFCESLGSFRSKSENDDEYEFACFVLVCIRICPWHETQAGNSLSAARQQGNFEDKGLHENNIYNGDFCT